MYETMTIAQIANVIAQDWRDKKGSPCVYFGARPYLSAMFDLQTLDDKYGFDDGRSIVAYFLANATTWRGQVAREVKKELNRRLKQK